MNEIGSVRRFRRRPTLLFGLMALLLGALALPKAALAHPADVYLQATYITVAEAQIIVELDLTPGVLVAPEVLSGLDTDGDEQLSEAEGQAYVEAMLAYVSLQVDGEAAVLTTDRIDMPSYLNIQAGYGTIRVFATAVLSNDMTGAHIIYYENSYAPTGSAYQVNAFVEKDAPITLGKQNRDEIQQSMTVDYTIGVVAADTAVAATESTAASSAQGQQLLDYLYEPQSSPWALFLGLSLAVVLGSLHALTPGHGKTLVAAYLIGSRGTVRHAVALGGIVTFTHTISVIVIGLLALFASQFIVPEALTPILEILSGLLVVVMGGRLVWQRWNAFRRPAHDHAHDHSHAHDHEHTHDHDHGDGRTHSHLPPAGDISLSSLAAMGISGGLLPCPEALGIMVVAIGLNRILLGLGLIVSFSFGLAAALIVIGVLLVRSRSLVERFGGLGSRWSSALPLASAVIVAALGLGIMFNGLSGYLG